MNNLQIAILYSSVIGSILNEFEQSPKHIMDLKMQIKKFMFKRSRTNAKEFHAAIKEGNKIWVRAVNYYANRNITIDAYSIIIALWSSQAEILARFVNLTEKRIEKFSLQNDSDLINPELSAYQVADYINTAVKNIGWINWIESNNKRYLCN